MSNPALLSISPIDGRYAGRTRELQQFFSEYALIKYRVLVEVRYFQELVGLPLPQLADFPLQKMAELDRIVTGFTEADAQRIKDIERTTNHDVKAVEYFLKEAFDRLGLEKYKEFIHFGLTSQDINNTATPLLYRDALHQVYRHELMATIKQLRELALEWRDVPMLARTHGQPASPTRLGKEIEVFVNRLMEQYRTLDQTPFAAKFGGATGNMNAHYIAYPEIDWHAFATRFVEGTLDMKRSHPTTQIEHYDYLAANFHALSRINTILVDLCRDAWTYISMNYFRQKTVAGEVGSSAMPHKVNPIDFENAEGNLGIANALFGHLAAKLPISRLQRDLTDSTVLRNVGVPLAHSLIALKAVRKGLGKLLLNREALNADLAANWAVVAEAIQNILRREGSDRPYEALKELTRGKSTISEQNIQDFVSNLPVSSSIRAEILLITPFTYLGR